MRRVVEEAGLALTFEAAVLWSWHDGWNETSWNHYIVRFRFVSLEEALALREYGFLAREERRDVDSTEPEDEVFPDHWLPLAIAMNSSNEMMVFDTLRNDVKIISLADGDVVLTVFDSLAEVVEIWNGLIDEGVIRWDTADGRWTSEMERSERQAIVFADPRRTSFI